MGARGAAPRLPMRGRAGAGCARQACNWLLLGGGLFGSPGALPALSSSGARSRRRPGTWGESKPGGEVGRAVAPAPPLGSSGPARDAGGRRRMRGRRGGRGGTLQREVNGNDRAECSRAGSAGAGLPGGRRATAAAAPRSSETSRRAPRPFPG